MKPLITGVACLAAGVVIGQLTAHPKSEGMPPTAVVSNVADLSPTRRLAQEIEVPINLRDTSIDEALDYLRVRSRKNSGANSTFHDDRLAFVLVDPNKTAKHVDLIHSHAKIDKLCEWIAELSGLTVAFEDDAIVFRANQNAAEQAVAPNGP
jgi:hypothetical protein